MADFINLKLFFWNSNLLLKMMIRSIFQRIEICIGKIESCQWHVGKAIIMRSHKPLLKTEDK